MRTSFLTGLVLLLAASSLFAGAVALNPSRDNTLYEDAGGSLSNGSMIALFGGKTGPFSGFSIRRALVYFDIAGSIPAGATVNSAAFEMFMTREPLGGPPPTTISLHRLLSDWGEGASDSGFPGGSGDPAEPGDATWLHTFFSGSFWGSPGGDFAGLPSATQTVSGINMTFSWSSALLVADVQNMLDNPATNFGWLIKGDEAVNQSARQFSSREGLNPPILNIEYTSVTAPGSGAATLAVLMILVGILGAVLAGRRIGLR